MRKKAAQAIPNQLLRRARLERGWTQKVVAERIGAPNEVIVTRWESGAAFPSAYYIERLCLLFEQRASDLGLLKETFPSGNPTNSASQQSHLKDSRNHLIQTIAAITAKHLPPVIGRETEIETLQQIYRCVQQGRTQIVLIQGEAGIGKTLLASAFLQWADAQGATLLQGRAFEMGGRIPYQPLVHALNHRVEAEQRLETQLDTIWLSELSRILPSLRERYPFLPVVNGDEKNTRINLFEAITRLGQVLSTQAPVVLFIDDLQWADEASLDVLHYAGQRWNEYNIPVLLLFAARFDGLSPSAPLRTWFTSLHHDVSVTEIPLGPLTLDHLHQLLKQLGIEPSASNHKTHDVAEFGRWLFRETHGQPFYITETIKVLIDRKILTYQDIAQADNPVIDKFSLETLQTQNVVPPGIRLLIVSQLERLSTSAYALLSASAMLGKSASFEMLYQIAGIKEDSEDEALIALNELLSSGLLREVNEEYCRIPIYIFGHDKIRTIMMLEMNKTRQQILHKRAFVVLKELARPASELAYHALAAGMNEQVIYFSVKAGDEAAQILAYADAYQHYTQALDIQTQLTTTQQIQIERLDILVKLVQSSWMNIEINQSLAYLTEAEELANKLQDKKRLAYIHYWISVVYGTGNAVRHARIYAERVIQEAQELMDEELLALSSVQLGRIFINQGRYGSVERLLTPVIQILEHAENRLSWIYALGFLGLALAAGGRQDEGLAYGKIAVEYTQITGKSFGLLGLMARHFYCTICLYSGNPSLLLEENIHILERSRQIDEKLLCYWASVFSGWANSLLGKYQEAMQDIERAEAVSQKLGPRIMGADLFQAIRARLLLETGHIQEALACAQSAVEISKSEVDGILAVGMAERVWGQALANLSRWDEAQIHLNASLQALLAGESYLEAARTHVAWGRLSLNEGDTITAQVHLEKAATQFANFGLYEEYRQIQEYLHQIKQMSHPFRENYKED